MSVSAIKTQLEQLGLTPNKALGQNFLCDEAAAARIGREACLAGLPVVEIGPGLGALTGVLVAHAAQVTAVEIDGAMVRALNLAFPHEPGLTVLHQDFLKCDLAGLFAPPGSAFTVAGNLPYYVTTPIIMRLLTSGLPIPKMVFMVQREAARRFFAAPHAKIYGPLTVLSSVYYHAESLMSLSPASYYPQPEVDSEVVILTRREETGLCSALPRLLDAAFAMRRKTLVNNLKATGLPAETVCALLDRCGIDSRARAEELEPGRFLLLARSMEQVLAD